MSRVEDPEALGAAAMEAFERWAADVPAGVRAVFAGDRARLLAAALLVPAVEVRRARSVSTGMELLITLTIVDPLSGPYGERRERRVICDSEELLLVSVVLLSVDYLERRDRSTSVPEELRAISSIAMMLGLGVE